VETYPSMKRLRRFFVRLSLLLLVSTLAVGSIILGAYVARSAYEAQIHKKPIASETEMKILGEQGEFFGGHLATIFSALTLALVVFTTYTQMHDAREAATRSMFSSGIDAVARYDIAHPGCAQALRLLDYYSRLALNFDDKQYYLFLNSVMTGSVRIELEKPDCPYGFALLARAKIVRIRALEELRADKGFIEGTWKFWRGKWRAKPDD
jgi:uncharacterized protein YneF (UPF0154 family)